MRRKRRIDRKLHRWHLRLDVIDASQRTHWRRLLFDAAEGETFAIDRFHTAGLPRYAARAIRRYRLRFEVCRVPQSETTFAGEDWGDCVFFRFRASRYPDIVVYSANNPAVV